MNLLFYFFIYIFLLYFLIQILGPYKSYPLNINVILEICKERVYTNIVSTHMHKQNLSMMYNLLAARGVN
jgi:hypothetical protein